VHFLKSKIQVMIEMVDEVEKTHKVTTDHVLVEELANMLQSWKLETCLPCHSDRPCGYKCDISHMFCVIAEQIGNDGKDLNRQRRAHFRIDNYRKGNVG